MTLVVISYPSRLEPVFEQAASHFARASAPDFAVERCQEPDELVYLAKRWKNRGRSIIRLDLHGHGDGGKFKLGDELLFASDGTGYGLAKRLGPKLAATAQLRLLGCHTASEAPRTPHSGTKLLRDLEKLLGRQRRVLGTTGYLGPHQWSARGLTDAAEALLVGTARAR
jgi:hypothetical protein